MPPVHLLILTALAITVFSSPVAATTLWQKQGQVGVHELGTKGYVRAGGGVSESHTQVCFKAPGAGAKYRLGNECEVYGKFSAYYQYNASDNDHASYFRYEYMPEFDGPYGHQVELTEPLQNYVEFGNIADTPIKVWIGRRQYFRRDIHINDFFYMKLQGDGINIRDVPLGFANFDYTYLEDELRPDGVNLSDRVKLYNHEFSLTDIETNDNGSLTVDLRLARIDKQSDSATGNTIYDADGWTLSFQHRQKEVLGGTNTAVLQYGKGAARHAWSKPFETSSALARLTSRESAKALEEADTWRLLDYHLYESDSWAMMSAFILEHRDSESFDGNDQNWFSLGARPTWFIDQHWRLTGEAGLDRVEHHDSMGNDGNLVKLTAALEWAPERRFFSRPAFRMYLTHAAWSDSFVGQVGGPIYADDDHGWNAGVQLEYWW